MILVVFLTLPRLVNVASTCHVLRSNSPHTLVSFYKALLLQAQRTRMDNDKASHSNHLYAFIWSYLTYRHCALVGFFYNSASSFVITNQGKWCRRKGEERRKRKHSQQQFQPPEKRSKRHLEKQFTFFKATEQGILFYKQRRLKKIKKYIIEAI